MGKYAIILVGSMIFGIIVYGQSIRKDLYSSEVETIQTFKYNKAKNIAQSSAMVAVHEIATSEDDASNKFIPLKGEAVTFTGSFLSGEYELNIKNVEDSVLNLHSTGLLGSTNYSVDVKMKKADPQWNPDLPWAVFSKNGFTLKPSSEIVGNAGTNSTGEGDVFLDWSTHIDSSLQIGPGADIETTVEQKEDNVLGDITNLSTEKKYGLPVFPDFPSGESDADPIDVDYQMDGTTYAPAQYDGLYIPELKIGSDWSITLNTGDDENQTRSLHVGKLLLEQGHLNIEGEGKLNIYVDDKIEVNGGSTLNENGEADKVFTYYKGNEKIDFGGNTSYNSGFYAKNADINLTGSGGIQGHLITGGNKVDITGDAGALTRVLYAPNAHVNIAGSGHLTGSIISKSFEASGGAVVTFSSDYGELPDLTKRHRPFTIKSWY